MERQKYFKEFEEFTSKFKKLPDEKFWIIPN